MITEQVRSSTQLQEGDFISFYGFKDDSMEQSGDVPWVDLNDQNGFIVEEKGEFYVELFSGLKIPVKILANIQKDNIANFLKC